MEPFVLHEEKGKPSSIFMLHSWCEPGDDEGLTAGFTTRHAGNVALHVGDDPQAVIANRESVAGLLGWKFAAFTCAEQVHGSDVYVVTAEDTGRGSGSRETAIADTDAMITNEPNVLLAMFYADCVPLYFHDPVTGAMGLAHAGWKGTVSEIAVKTVAKMQEVYGALPENIRAAIGPSIGDCCYEVDESVLKHVRPLLDNLTEDIVKLNEFGDRAQLNLKHLNRQLMIKAGIMPSRIEISSWCTSCHTEMLFSHRKEKGATGRMMSWLGKKSR